MTRSIQKIVSYLAAVLLPSSSGERTASVGSILELALGLSPTAAALARVFLFSPMWLQNGLKIGLEIGAGKGLDKGLDIEYVTGVGTRN